MLKNGSLTITALKKRQHQLLKLSKVTKHA